MKRVLRGGAWALVHRGEDVHAEAAAFGDEVVELRAGIRLALAAGGEAEVVLVAELLELVQAMDEQKDGGRAARHCPQWCDKKRAGFTDLPRAY
jgi:hypothetical protein